MTNLNTRLVLSEGEILNKLKVSKLVQDATLNTSLESWVGPIDSFMSMDAFLHTQQVYSFYPEHFIVDMVTNYPRKLTLTPLQASEIGIFSLFRQNYYMAVDWLEWAWEAGKSTLTLDMLIIAIQEVGLPL